MIPVGERTLCPGEDQRECGSLAAVQGRSIVLPQATALDAHLERAEGEPIANLFDVASADWNRWSPGSRFIFNYLYGALFCEDLFAHTRAEHLRVGWDNWRYGAAYEAAENNEAARENQRGTGRLGHKAKGGHKK